MGELGKQVLQEGGICGPRAGLALPLIASCVIHINLVPSWGHGLVSGLLEGSLSECMK